MSTSETLAQTVRNALSSWCETIRLDSAHRGHGKSAQQIEIDGLTKLRNLLATEIESRISQLKDAHNQSLPIYNIPAELFLEILTNAIPQPYDWKIKQTGNLIRVSRLWRNTVDPCPRFWPLIDFDTPERNIVVLNKNTRGPLWIKCCTDYYDEDSQEESPSPLEDFLSNVRHHRSRWRSINIEYANQSECLEAFSGWATDAPLLEELFVVHNIDYDGYEDDGDYPTIPLLHAPRLRRLALSRVSLSSWESWSYGNLESLALDGLSEEAPSVEQFHTILSSSPNLRHISLSSWSPRQIEDTPTTHATPFSGPIHLPHLQSASLRDLPEDITSLFTAVTAPACRSVSTRASTTAEIWASLNLCASALRHRKLIDVDNIVSREDSDPISLISSPPPSSHILWARGDVLEPGLNLNVARTEFELAWEGLLSILYQLPEADTAFRIHLGHGPHFPFSFNERFNPYPFPLNALGAGSAYIRSIRICDYPLAKDVIEYLSAPLEGTAAWPCPYLLELDLRNNDDLTLVGEVKSFVDRRYASGRSEGDTMASGDGSWPTMLKRVGLGEGGQWEEVKAIFISLGVEVIGKGVNFPETDLEL